MGLAAKLAAAQSAGGAATPGYGGAPQGGAPYGGAPAGGPPQSLQPGGRPLPQPGSQQQPGQYGAQPQQSQYGAQPQGGQYGGHQPPTPVGYQGGPPGQQQQQQQQQPQYGQPQQSPYGQPQGQPGGYGAPLGQYGQPQQAGAYGAPQQQQQPYGQKTNAPPYGQQQGGYGQPPQGQQQQQGYGAPPPVPGGRPGAQGAAPAGTGTLDYNTVIRLLQSCVVEQKIQAFYPPGSLEQIAQQIVSNGALAQLAGQWRLPMEIAADLVKISLFDVILYLDDSGSMAFEEGGSRIDDLKLIVARIAQATSLFDRDGIQVFFMNSKNVGNGIRSEADAMNLVSQVRFSGLTPLGTALQQKILEPLVLGPARANRLAKPVLIIGVTDGVPGGEDRYTIVKVLTNAARELSRTRYGADAMSVTIAQIGTDQKAQQFLAELDTHPEVGDLIDVTSNYELEADEMMKKGVELSPETWLCKLLLGSIDNSWDSLDEA